MNKTYKTIPFIFLCLAALLVVSYNNCSKAKFSRVSEGASKVVGGQGGPGGGGSDDPPDEDDVDDVAQTCANSTPQELIADFAFPNPGVTCPFGQGDNLPAKNQYFQGRIEQVVNFQLPQSSTICDLEFSFAPQQMKYDDHFILTFNDAVLASTYNFDPQWDKVLNIPIYSWQKIAGLYWNSGSNYEGVFCLGMVDGDSTCSWPQTDTNGVIELDFNPELIQRIFALDTSSSNHSFSFVTLGDNDSLDCEHSDINFSIRVHYVEN